MGTAEVLLKRTRSLTLSGLQARPDATASEPARAPIGQRQSTPPKEENPSRSLSPPGPLSPCSCRCPPLGGIGEEGGDVLAAMRFSIAPEGAEAGMRGHASAVLFSVEDSCGADEYPCRPSFPRQIPEM